MCDSALDQRNQKVRSASLTAMPKEIRLLEDILLHMNHGMTPLSGVSNDRGLNFLAILLLHRAFGSLWRAREDAICGYPVQSLSLCRSALEDWGTLCYVERHPEKGNLWLRDVLEEVEASGREPKFSEIWKDLGDLRQKIAEKAYSILSLFAHPRGVGLPWLYHWDAGKTYFHMGGYFDRRALEMCLYFLVIVAQPLLERTAQLQSRVLGDAIPEWVREGKDISKQASQFIERVGDRALDGLEAGGISG